MRELDDHDRIIKMEQKLEEHSMMLEYHFRSILASFAAIFTAMSVVLTVLYYFILPPINIATAATEQRGGMIIERLDALNQKTAVLTEQTTRLYQMVGDLSVHMGGVAGTKK